MKHICIFFIRAYRRWISPMKTPCCRFTPTCSQYALGAFNEWGFVIGLYLSVFRVARCNPFSKGGYDPVPQKRNKKDKR